MSDTFFTIVTSTLNSGDRLAATACSIVNQTCKSIQWIVVDGASTDNSIDVVNSVQSIDVQLISEKDKGIYDAWNKALPLVEGRWILFLGAGDRLYHSGTLEKVFLHLTHPDAINSSICYGSVMRVSTISDDHGFLDAKKWRGVDAPWLVGRPIIPCHQGVFHRSSIFSNGRTFDESMKIAADSEIVLGELISNRSYDLNMPVTKMLSGGISDDKQYRAQMVWEVIKVNHRVGIFYRRPVLQVSLLAYSWIKYSLLKVYD